MRRLRPSSAWSGQLLAAQCRSTPASAASSQLPLALASRRHFHPVRPRLSALASTAELPLSAIDDASLPLPPSSSSSIDLAARDPYPSPPPDRALASAKLAALHARLSLPPQLPLQTLARALVDGSADPNPSFNNANLAFLGQALVAHHASEWLVCRFPRLPMGVLYEAMRGYAGHASLYRVARQWGVDSAAVPGEEVDPGLLQWTDDPAREAERKRWGYVRTEHEFLDKFKWRRGMSSRVVMDDEFGDAVHRPGSHALAPEVDPAALESSSLPGDWVAADRLARESLRDLAHATFVRAVVGAVHLHCGASAARDFVRSHVLLSRRLDLPRLFKFDSPTRELAKLCAREGFERPVARLLSETGRRSRTPVYVVGIYSGRDKLGEGAGASLDFARFKAAMTALQAWYLYSPGQDVRVPSDVLVEGAAPWTPAYVDIGEIV